MTSTARGSSGHLPTICSHCRWVGQLTAWIHITLNRHSNMTRVTPKVRWSFFAIICFVNLLFIFVSCMALVRLCFCLLCCTSNLARGGPAWSGSVVPIFPIAASLTWYGVASLSKYENVSKDILAMALLFHSHWANKLLVVMIFCTCLKIISWREVLKF